VSSDELGEKLPGVAFRHRGDVLRCGLGDSGSALGTTLWAHVHDPVLRLDHGHLVFDDHDRSAVSTTPLMTLSSLRMPSKRGPVVGDTASALPR
jgi:hypothetical protein